MSRSAGRAGIVNTCNETEKLQVTTMANDFYNTNFTGRRINIDFVKCFGSIPMFERIGELQRNWRKYGNIHFMLSGRTHAFVVGKWFFMYIIESYR